MAELIYAALDRAGLTPPVHYCAAPYEWRMALEAIEREFAEALVKRIDQVYQEGFEEGLKGKEMKFTVEKQTLVAALDRCVSIADSRSVMPILGNLYLATNRTRLLVGATDLFRAISVEIGVQSDGVGSICLPAAELFERIKSLPEGDVAVSVEGTKSTLRTVGNTRRFVMHGFPGDEFPTLPEPTGSDWKLVTTTHTMAGPIESVRRSISTDGSRPQLNAMLLVSDPKGMRFVSTDGHRLTTVLCGSEPSGSRWLVPLPAVTDLKRFCDTKADQEVTFTQDRNTLFASFDGFTYSTKLADVDAFPPWEMIIPKTQARSVTVDRRSLIEALRAVAVASNDKTRRVLFTFKRNALLLQAETATAGEGFDELPTDYDGDTAEVGFDNKLVLDALGTLAVDHVLICTSGPIDPGVIRVVGSDAYMALISPMSA